MGIYSRYSAAFLVLALISPQVFSAVRVPVIQNNEYIRQVLSKQTATTGAITTPAGDVAFYGAEKVFSFATGDSVRPTVREVVSTVGTPSYPYGPGAAYPNDPNYSPAAATKIKVKPQVVVPKANILKGLKDGLKINPGQLMLSGAVAAAVGAVGWVMSPDNTQLQMKQDSAQNYTPTGNQFYWRFLNHSTGNFPSPLAGCSTLTLEPGDSMSIRKEDDHVYSCMSYNWGVKGTIIRYGSDCPSGLTYNSDHGTCMLSQYVPLTDTALNTLDPWISGQSAEWLSGLIRDVCEGGLNPGGCYSNMVDRSKGLISGPPTAQGPITSKTTSTMNPDGSVSTKVETTSTKYNFQYSNNYFDVDTEKKTTTTVDGEPVSETIENDNTPVEEVPDPTEQPEEPEPEYTFEDSPFPEVEPFYEQKYPDGLQGVWDQAKSDIDNSNFLSFLRSFVPSFSGSCPSFGMSFAIGSMANFGTHEFQSLCYVFDFIKVILMVSAVFLARQLTFGG